MHSVSLPLLFWLSVMGFPGGSVVKNLPAKQEMQVQSLGREDPLEKEMATHFSTLAWEIPWTERPGGLQSMGSQRVGHDLTTEHMPAHSSPSPDTDPRSGQEKKSTHLTLKLPRK